MDISEMNPDELRAYALEKEQSRENLTAKYMNRPSCVIEPIKQKPWEKTVEYDGRTFDIDMRRFHSRDFIKRISYLQHVNPDSQDFSEQIDLLESVFDGTRAYDQIVAYVIEECGYEDYIKVLNVEGEILNLIDVKN